MHRPTLCRCRISDSALLHMGKKSKRVSVRLLPADNMLYPRATNQQSISDQRAVAAPRDSFSAHDGGRARGRELAQTLQAFLELRLLHVIRKAAKRCIEPAHIGRIAASVAQAAERREMRVTDALRA